MRNQQQRHHNSHSHYGNQSNNADYGKGNGGGRPGGGGTKTQNFDTDIPLGPLNEDYKFFIANLGYETAAKDIREWISMTFGEVNHVKVIYHKDGTSKGYGFLHMQTNEGSVALEQFALAHGGKVTMMGRKNVHLQKHDESQTKPKYNQKSDHDGPSSSSRGRYGSSRGGDSTGYSKHDDRGGGSYGHDRNNGNENSLGHVGGQYSNNQAVDLSGGAAAAGVGAGIPMAPPPPPHQQQTQQASAYNANYSDPSMTTIGIANGNDGQQQQQYTNVNANASYVNPPINIPQAGVGIPQLQTQQPLGTAPQLQQQQAGYSNVITDPQHQQQQQIPVQYAQTSQTYAAQGHAQMNPTDGNAGAGVQVGNLQYPVAGGAEQVPPQQQQQHYNNAAVASYTQQPQQPIPNSNLSYSQVPTTPANLQLQQQQVGQPPALQGTTQSLPTAQIPAAGGHQHLAVPQAQNTYPPQVQQQFGNAATSAQGGTQIQPSHVAVPGGINPTNGGTVAVYSGSYPQSSQVLSSSYPQDPQQQQGVVLDHQGQQQQMPPPPPPPPPQRAVVSSAGYSPMPSSSQPQPMLTGNTKVLLSNVPNSVEPTNLVTFLVKEWSKSPRRCTMESDGTNTTKRAHIDFQNAEDANYMIQMGLERKLILKGNYLDAQVDPNPPSDGLKHIPVAVGQHQQQQQIGVPPPVGGPSTSYLQNDSSSYSSYDNSQRNFTRGGGRRGGGRSGGRMGGRGGGGKAFRGRGRGRGRDKRHRPY